MATHVPAKVGAALSTLILFGHFATTASNVFSVVTAAVASGKVSFTHIVMDRTSKTHEFWGACKDRDPHHNALRFDCIPARHLGLVEMEYCGTTSQWCICYEFDGFSRIGLASTRQFPTQRS
jgi:hypothetical protein